MYLVKEPRLLAKAIKVRRVSERSVARAAGYSSHSYIQRLLAGEARSCTPEAAEKISTYLGLPMERLFVPRKSSDDGQHSGRTA
jgi:transcriptional regulator with XRE-family HTH domain